MTKLLFASLLTAAVVLAQSGGGTTGREDQNGTKSTTSRRKTKAKINRKDAGKTTAKETKQPSTTPPQ